MPIYGSSARRQGLTSMCAPCSAGWSPCAPCGGRTAVGGLKTGSVRVPALVAGNSVRPTVEHSYQG